MSLNQHNSGILSTFDCNRMVSYDICSASSSSYSNNNSTPQPSIGAHQSLNDKFCKVLEFRMHQLLRSAHSSSSTRRAVKKYDVLVKKEQKKQHKRQMHEMMISLQEETSCPHGERPLIDQDITRPTSSRQSFAHNSSTPLADPARKELFDRQMRLPSDYSSISTTVSNKSLSLLINGRRKFSSFRDGMGSCRRKVSLPRSQQQPSRRRHPIRPITGDSLPGPTKDATFFRQERPTKNIQPPTSKAQAVQKKRRVSLTLAASIEEHLDSESISSASEFEMFESEFFPEGI